jgi:autophagy-related protein 11
LSTQLRVAQQEKAEQERRIVEIEKAHQETMRQMEQSTEQRISSLQNRLAEMQEELVRLRTDLGEELLARQALSTELNERSREQDDRQREQDDQMELITALQVELAQEKDRATDLGVRLQEALLDVDGLKNAEQTLIAQLQGLQDERTKSLTLASETELEKQSLRSEIAGLQAIIESTSSQLDVAQQERDAALRNQSAEAERVMRDHIAEADGDRAVLEHQNLTLTKQLEDLRIETEEKVTATRNTSVRLADGLKAELSFTKAQLRDAQRREAVLADELAMAKDTATSVNQAQSHHLDVSRDAVSLASKYHETCQRLLGLINASSTISGPAARSQSPPKSPPHSNLGTSINAAGNADGEQLRESTLIRSLAPAQQFDLVAFAEAVTRTIGLVKKWSKSCKQYREFARNKITFGNFSKGDLVGGR